MRKLIKAAKELLDGASDAELELGFLLLFLFITLFIGSL